MKKYNPNQTIIRHKKSDVGIYYFFDGVIQISNKCEVQNLTPPLLFGNMELLD
jgi:hypothetical protein